MRKIKHYFQSDKEMWFVRLYFILCIAIALLLCRFFGNALCDKQSIGGSITGVALFTAILLFIGGYLKGFVERKNNAR